MTAGVEAIGPQSGLADSGIWCQAADVGLPRSGRPHRSPGARVIHVGHLWLQTARESVQLDVRKMHTSCNAADVLTKALPFGVVRDLFRRPSHLGEGTSRDCFVRATSPILRHALTPRADAEWACRVSALESFVETGPHRVRDTCCACSSHLALLSVLQKGPPRHTHITPQ